MKRLKLRIIEYNLINKKAVIGKSIYDDSNKGILHLD